jgi:hypothetical protein
MNDINKTDIGKTEADAGNEAPEQQISACCDLLEADHDKEKITCWCGAVGTYDELFESDYLDMRCGGLGILDCHCGGDLCVCHNHGEVECYGCPDCEGDDDDYYDDEGF